MGFSIPMDHWLRGPLRQWAETLLSEESLRVHELFDPAPIRSRWKEHLSGTRNWQYFLWDVLVFQDWYLHQSSAQHLEVQNPALLSMPNK